MRKTIFIILMFISILENKIYAQEGVILDVVSSEQTAYYDKKDSHHSIYIGTLDRGLGALMSLNIFGYYNLYHKYDSELKRKVFLESEEGKKLLNELKKKKEKVVSTPSFLRIRLFAGFDNNASYNLETKTFDIEFQTGFSPISGYMSFPELAVKCNLPVKEYLYRYFPKGSMSDLANPLYNTIKLPMPEKIAIQIEESIQQFEFVLEFKMTSYKTFSEGFVNNYFVPLGNVVNMYIVDKESYEIYYAVDKNRLKVLKIQQEKIRQEKLKQEELERTERIKREKEQEEQKRLEKLKREENVKKIFSSVNEFAIESKVTNYFNNKYVEKIKTYKGKLDTLKLGYTGEVNVMIGGDSLGVDVIKIEDEDENEKVILDNWIRASKYYCTLEGIDYYEFQGKIFCLKKLNIKTHSFEYGFGGLKNKGKKFTFYRNVPDLVKKACEQNFRQRGEYFFYYLMIDNEVAIEKLELEREQRDAIRGGKTTGRKILNTIGLIGAAALG